MICENVCLCFRILECIEILAVFGYYFKRSPSEMAERYQEEDLGTQQEQQNQNEYLRIIDDLSAELNSLSRQVNMVQKEFPTDEITKQFESSLKVLETQNDLLQAAVESLMEERETTERTLHTQNEELKKRLCEQEEDLCGLEKKISDLQKRPCERCAAREQPASTKQEHRRRAPRSESAEELLHLEFELSRRTKHMEKLKSDNTRLVEELTEIRQSQAKMKILQRREAARVQERSIDQDVTALLNASQEKNREQSRSLQKATKEIASLQQELEEIYSNKDTFSKERDLLQTELIALKESQASQHGIQQSLREQLQGTVNELYNAKQMFHESVQGKDQLENVYRVAMKRTQDEKADMLQKFNSLVEDFNSLLQAYWTVVHLEQEKSDQIKAFTAWKEEQIQTDRDVRKKMQMLEDHLREMLEDKEKLMAGLAETQNDNRSLLEALDRSRSISIGNHLKGLSVPPGGYSTVTDSDPVSKVIENVRNTSRKITQQRHILENDARQYLSK